MNYEIEGQPCLHRPAKFLHFQQLLVDEELFRTQLFFQDRLGCGL